MVLQSLVESSHLVFRVLSLAAAFLKPCLEAEDAMLMPIDRLLEVVFGQADRDVRR